MYERLVWLLGWPRRGYRPGLSRPQVGQIQGSWRPGTRALGRERRSCRCLQRVSPPAVCEELQICTLLPGRPFRFVWVRTRFGDEVGPVFQDGRALQASSRARRSTLSSMISSAGRFGVQARGAPFCAYQGACFGARQDAPNLSRSVETQCVGVPRSQQSMDVHIACLPARCMT